MRDSRLPTGDVITYIFLVFATFYLFGRIIVSLVFGV